MFASGAVATMSVPVVDSSRQGIEVHGCVNGLPDHRPPPSELTALLWIVAGLIGVLDVAWWFSNSIFSP
jgi:hypothetical protein